MIYSLAFSGSRRHPFEHHWGLSLGCQVNSSERFGRKLIARGNFDFGFDKRSLSQWLKRLEKPVAVFCAHDLLAWNVLKRCQATGIAVPGEVSIVEKTFREKIGASVRETIAATRIEEAKRLLERTTLSLAEICTLSGFSSKPYFTTAFNGATGMTPLQWRTAHARPSQDRTCRD